MSQIARNADYSLKDQWSLIEHLSKNLVINNPENMNEALAMLQQIRHTTDENIIKVFLIDTNSYCYQSDGQRFRWSNQGMLVSGENECQISTAEFMAGEDSTYMMFILRLNSLCSLTNIR